MIYSAGMDVIVIDGNVECDENIHHIEMIFHLDGVAKRNLARDCYWIWTPRNRSSGFRAAEMGTEKWTFVGVDTITFSN